MDKGSWSFFFFFSKLTFVIFSSLSKSSLVCQTLLALKASLLIFISCLKFFRRRNHCVRVGWIVSCSIGKNPFSVGLVAQLFQSASNWVETVEKALVAAAVVFAGSKNCYTRHVYPVDPRTGRLYGSLVMTIPRSDRVSTENGLKSVLLENVNCVNLNQFRLIPIEHDLGLTTWHTVCTRVNKNCGIKISEYPSHDGWCFDHIKLHFFSFETALRPRNKG